MAYKFLKNENSNGLISGPSQMELENHNDTEMFQESFQPPDRELEMKNSDIWKLFKDAQRNILYLNKQRLMAMEELNKTQREKQILIDRIEKLELGKQANMQQEKPAICSELLLRIDSLVLTGMISKGEASNFRRLVTENKVGLLDAFSEIWQKRDSELLEELHLFSDESKRKAFHVIHICTEMAPVVSVGSLGSYVTGLSWALQRKGNLVEIILPKYTSLDLDQVKGLRKVEAEFYSYFNGQSHGNRIWTGVVYGIGVTLIEPIFYLGLFNREKIYGYSDDFERFTYFSRASLDYLVKSGKQPDILHIHNWETAIIGPLFWDIFVNNQGLGSTRILFTCHGFGSQCLEKPDKLALCGLDPSRLHRADRLQDNSKRHLVNILKGGIVYSNKVVMMSSIHSKSRIIRSLSHGLEPTLSIHKEKLLLAPYGLDDTVWDPSKDKHLPAKYSADDTKGKTICKVALLQQLGLSRHASSSTTVVGCIYSNFTDVDIENLKSAFRLASRRGAQFIFMGTSKVESVNTALELFKKEIKDENARFINKYDEALLHLMFAGSDIMLCSSFLDPVLQVPLKAIKYGAAPVDITLNSNRIRHSMDHDLESTRSSQYIMTTFANMSLSEALDQIQSDPSRWDWKIKEGMSKDFSWEAECYDVHLGAYTSIMNV
ncbi:PREDICTED: probable starch synthase 4, chloroplastic/amyloplastic isoform X2 [Nelumbo nucifera]|uniref:starch synthase n=1 Tax=Nelumbo nucifera TaxID=4432 RepID=A0A1U7ZZI7_NELNU|nr:PREDICTED: probable starch synthase 4, chloroplastic/amyloplastic isoform X2 [Nelumbo nucifera]XP_010254669.1 PREDICTED: probable starch synthase 4, chloroplastic/amyloplastic isoform X2 [Nelumbo nucifera]